MGVDPERGRSRQRGRFGPTPYAGRPRLRRQVGFRIPSWCGPVTRS